MCLEIHFSISLAILNGVFGKPEPFYDILGIWEFIVVCILFVTGWFWSAFFLWGRGPLRLLNGGLVFQSEVIQSKMVLMAEFKKYIGPTIYCCLRSLRGSKTSKEKLGRSQAILTFVNKASQKGHPKPSPKIAANVMLGLQRDTRKVPSFLRCPDFF